MNVLRKFRFLLDPYPWLLLLLSLFYRHLLFHGGIPPWYYTDGANYFQVAHQILHEGTFGPRIWLAPGYPLFLAFAAWLGKGQWRPYAAYLQHGLALLSLLLIYASSVRFFQPFRYKRPLAFFVGLLYLYVRFPLYDHSILADSPFTFLVVLQTYLLVRYFGNGRWPWLLAFGLCIGVSTLVKPIDKLGVFTAIAAVLVYRKQWKDRLRAVLLIVIPFFLVLSPWLMRNYLHFDYFGISPYGDFQLLLRSGKYLNIPGTLAQYSNEEDLLKVPEPPDSASKAMLQSVALTHDPDPKKQAAQYDKLYRLLIKKRMVHYILQYNGYRNAVPSWVLADFLKSGFKETEVVRQFGAVARELLAETGSAGVRNYLRESLFKQLPQMMLFGDPNSIERANVGGVIVRMEKLGEKADWRQRLLKSVTKHSYFQFPFVILTPLGLLGWIYALVAGWNRSFSVYAFLRLLYFPAVVALMGNGLERYRLPIDHLIFMGVACCLIAAANLFSRLRKTVSPALRPILPSDPHDEAAIGLQ